MATQASRDGRLAAIRVRLGGRRDRALPRREVVEALGERGLRHAVRAQAIVELLPRVFVAADRRDEYAVRCQAVLIWGRGRLRITGSSALHLANPRFRAPALVHAVGPVAHHAHAPDWLRIRRTQPPTITALYQGVACTPPEHAFLEAWRTAAPTDREDLLYVALWTQVVQSQPLLAMVRSAARVVARAQLEGILEEFEEGARSPGEVLAKRRVFAGRQFAEFERRVHMVVAGRDRYPDMVHRRARLVVECDGDAFHGSPAAVAADRERDADFLTIGYATLRFSFHDLLDRPERCRRTVLSVMADRLGAE